ncbi:noggin-2-like [Corticium candelabrum]|uniref:noggin-2-like n=1 Tax=Corticium candelabrum TaxID=121492 RepID=UPI002E354F7F|nr:noggin-2-like [Corticium candelabrum]
MPHTAHHPTLLILLLTGAAGGMLSTLGLTHTDYGTVDPDKVFTTIDIRNITTKRLQQHLQPKPKKESIDDHQRLSALHDDFDSEFMSIKKPAISHNESGPMWDFADNLIDMLLSRARSIKKGTRQAKRDNLVGTFVQAARAWHQYETNRMTEYRWIDLTRRFWPRWIKTGECSPECKSKGSKCHRVDGQRKIQRWQCLRLGSDRHCFWLPTTVKLVTGCWSSC